MPWLVCYRLAAFGWYVHLCASIASGGGSSITVMVTDVGRVGLTFVFTVRMRYSEVLRFQAWRFKVTAECIIILSLGTWKAGVLCHDQILSASCLHFSRKGA